MTPELVYRRAFSYTARAAEILYPSVPTDEVMSRLMKFSWASRDLREVPLQKALQLLLPLCLRDDYEAFSSIGSHRPLWWPAEKEPSLFSWADEALAALGFEAITADAVYRTRPDLPSIEGTLIWVASICCGCWREPWVELDVARKNLLVACAVFPMDLGRVVFDLSVDVLSVSPVERLGGNLLWALCVAAACHTEVDPKALFARRDAVMKDSPRLGETLPVFREMLQDDEEWAEVFVKYEGIVDSKAVRAQELEFFEAAARARASS